ncbi:hypothetical protein [Mycobacterium tuberculosis]|uniref:hypothetical protein n=1 Tax=Mycobacterium tuberculosis TaxID=1773 RepID=UPI0027295A99|nr:hypothetical protein [Mycobacterium tuberculosis]
MKRVFLFLATNFAVVLLLSVTAQVLGINRWLTANGLNLGGLLAFAALFGFGGAFISLAMSNAGYSNHKLVSLYLGCQCPRPSERDSNQSKGKPTSVSHMTFNSQ